MSQSMNTALSAQQSGTVVSSLTPLLDKLPAICAAASDKNLLRKLLRTQQAAYWKGHGLVVSNRSLADYRGASLTLETQHAKALIQLLEQLEPLIEQYVADHPSAQSPVYFYQRIGQAVNELPKDSACMPCLETVVTTLNRLLKEDPNTANNGVGF